MSGQTLAQRRAAHALGKIEGLQSKGGYGNYKSYVKALPANILMSGLGQAVATVRSRKGKRDGYGELYDHMATWLCGNDDDAPYRNYRQADLLRAIVEHDQDRYIHAQAEAMAYLEWLRKFADAFLEGGEEPD
ncbi:MAG: type III-B CRISPR module-associated protein Cmr5 [Deinococcota bacterium]|nr:type III-B CRISPR module-associated protein Cmr5 [Deinococcota bacterium]